MANPATLLAAEDFRKSSFSGDGSGDQCVYLANLRDMATVEFRDSKQGLHIPGFAVGLDAFRTFVAQVSTSGQVAH